MAPKKTHRIRTNKETYQIRRDELLAMLRCLYPNVCHYCKTPLHDEWGKRHLGGFATIDHLIPLSKGGDNNPGNLVLACWQCNSDKNVLTEEEYGKKLNRKK